MNLEVFNRYSELEQGTPGINGTNGTNGINGVDGKSSNAFTWRFNNVSYGEYTSGLFNARNDSGFQVGIMLHIFISTLQTLMVIL